MDDSSTLEDPIEHLSSEETDEHVKNTRRKINDFVWGPTTLAMAGSQKRVRLMAGGMGTGKTMSIIAMSQVILRAIPPDENGIRYSKLLITRQTYGKLKTTTIADMYRWFRKGMIYISRKPPHEGWIKYDLPDGTYMHIDLVLLAQDNDADLNALRGLNATMAICIEAQETQRINFEMIYDRCGRLNNVPGTKVLLADCNLPPASHWLHEAFVTDIPDFYQMFKMPPALLFHPDPEGDYKFRGQLGFWRENAAAENIHVLPDGFDYWWDMVHGKRSDNYLLQHVLGEFAPDIMGEPVYPSFDRDQHISEVPLYANPETQLVVGVDLGLNGAFTFTQISDIGKLQVLLSMYALNQPWERFFKDRVLPTIMENYRNFRMFFVLDPSHPRDSNTGVTAGGLLTEANLDWDIAPSRETNVRIESLRHFMDTDRLEIDARQENGFLIEGLAGGHHYIQSKVHASRREVNKDSDHSHSVESLEYAATFFTTLPTQETTRRRQREDYDLY